LVSIVGYGDFVGNTGIGCVERVAAGSCISLPLSIHNIIFRFAMEIEVHDVDIESSFFPT
jgi:hypothetical protein